MFRIYWKNVPFCIEIAWSCNHSRIIWNEIENKSNFHICCQSSFKRWGWVNLPADFLMNISVNKILFAVESSNYELSCGALLVLKWPCSICGFWSLWRRIKCFKLPISRNISRYLTEGRESWKGTTQYNLNKETNPMNIMCCTEGTMWDNCY